MADCGLEVKKDTFISLSEEGRSAVLYDYLDYMKKKLDKLEKKEKADHKQLMAVGGMFGFLGGIAAAFAKWFTIGG